MFTTTATDKTGEFAMLKNIYGSHQNRFVFPRVFDRSEFDSVEAIRTTLHDIAAADDVPELEKIFEFLFTPLKSNYKNLTVRCKLCKTQMKFFVNEGKFLLISMENRHVHHNEKWKRIEEKYITSVLARLEGNSHLPIQAPIQPTTKTSEMGAASSLMAEEIPDKDDVKEMAMATSKQTSTPIAQPIQATPSPILQPPVSPSPYQRLFQDDFMEDPSFESVQNKKQTIMPTRQKQKNPEPPKQTEVKYTGQPTINQINQQMQPNRPIEIPKPTKQAAPQPAKASRLDPPKTLIDMVNRLGFSSAAYFSDKTATGALPDVIVAMTSNMKQRSLDKFGDVISFESTDCLVDIQNGPPYRLSFFTAFDTNCRILIVGVALHRNDTVADLFRVFKKFLKLCSKQPAALITSCHPETIRTIDILKELSIFKGEHLYDPVCVADQLSTHFSYDQKLMKELSRLINKVIQEGNQEHALKTLDAMCQLVPEDSSDTILKFLEKKDKVCLWSLPPTFVGVCFSSSKQIAALVSQHFKSGISFTDFLNQVTAIDGILTKESTGPGKHFQEATEDIFRDANIKQVRTSIEENIFKLFIRAYLLSVKEDNLYGKSICEHTMREITHVQNRFTGNLYDIVDGGCSCQLAVKMGMPCQHLITVARANHAGYLGMFAQRWLRNAKGAASTEMINE